MPPPDSTAPSPSFLQRVQRDPFRLLFPVGLVLLCAGILPWATFAASGSGYRSTFHAVVQIQSFLTAFAAGFLFTFIPRRTATRPPAPLELAVGVLAPTGVAVAAWFDAWLLTQVLWLAMIGTLVRFVLSRAKPKALDAGLIWVPLSFAMGITGSVLMSVGPMFAWYWSHSVGQALLTQGMFTGLCLGIGRMLFPIMLHGRPPVFSGARNGFGWNAAVGIAFFASFFLEAWGPARAAWALRAILTGVLVLAGLRGLTPPSQSGLHRKVLWLSAWAIPIGYAWMAVFPAQRLAGLHVLVIGGFTAMVIAVSVHVVLAHGGYGKLLGSAPAELKVGVPLLLVALAARVAMAADPARLREWAGVAAIALLLATAAWARLLVSGFKPRPRPQE